MSPGASGQVATRMLRTARKARKPMISIVYAVKNAQKAGTKIAQVIMTRASRKAVCK
jgi:hypothetical protein